ncbi:hypothetical protein D7Y13_14715 [Corallococcus praedator]|uniref:Uncharacterized protein n=1 Tax=Corallococcus praedator TaxID=2316724 RepID=A0ABX9QID7_9BACT|nr:MULTISPECIES: hypothetical protein [Corallococcus]RKH32131.1 hypothetical protein D7X75_16860 [Corallococcus sp. CA031C]RKI09187.1 hypothetical protein D7Y13_14715 [Corallococcus praedator]
MRRTNVLTLQGLLLTSGTVFACETCRPAVEAGIFNEHFWGRLAITLLPFAIIGCVATRLHFAGRTEEER